MFNVPELIIIAFIILLVFGPNRLPELAKSMGKGIRGFKQAVDGVEELKPDIAKVDKSDSMPRA